MSDQKINQRFAEGLGHWATLSPNDLTWLTNPQTNTVTRNPYVHLLEEWKIWLEDRGLRYQSAGSSRTEVPRGHWIIQNYDILTLQRYPDTRACFNEFDAGYALLFKRVWGVGR